jgi:ubiquinone/menaquinone biosynthesis C-methylase UbiE
MTTEDESLGKVYTEKLAEIYDQIYHFKDYSSDVEYILRSVIARNPEAKELLDVACGTGSHIGGLTSRFKVEGIDASAAMLRRARLKNPEVLFSTADMVDFDLDRQFDVVTCLFRTISFMQTCDRLNSAVASMARHLKPGGLLLIEPFFSPEAYWIGDIKMNTFDREDMKIAWMYVSEREENVGVMRNHFLVGRPTGVEHFEEEHRMGLFRRLDYEHAFEAAGLALEYDPVGPGKIGFYIGRRQNS